MCMPSTAHVIRGYMLQIVTTFGSRIGNVSVDLAAIEQYRISALAEHAVLNRQFTNGGNDV